MLLFVQESFLPCRAAANIRGHAGLVSAPAKPHRK
jgi:hypothetical protein